MPEQDASEVYRFEACSEEEGWEQLWSHEDPRDHLNDVNLRNVELVAAGECHVCEDTVPIDGEHAIERFGDVLCRDCSDEPVVFVAECQAGLCDWSFNSEGTEFNRGHVETRVRQEANSHESRKRVFDDDPMHQTEVREVEERLVTDGGRDDTGAEQEGDVTAFVDEDDDGSLAVVVGRYESFRTLDGDENIMPVQLEVMELPADEEIVDEVCGALRSWYCDQQPSGPPGQKSVTQQMDEVYDR